SRGGVLLPRLWCRGSRSPPTQVELHHDRVDTVRLVVARAAGDLLEPLRDVEALCTGIVGANLEEHLTGTTGGCFVEQSPQHPATSSLPAPRLDQRDRLDVGIRIPTDRSESG